MSLIAEIANIIKLALKTKVNDDSGQYPTAQVSYMGRVADVAAIYPYGLAGNAPNGGLGLMFNIQGMEENRAIIEGDPTNRPKNLKEGEVVLSNHLTGAFVKFLEDGSIEINSPGDLNITAAGDLNMTVAGDINLSAASGTVTATFATAGIAYTTVGTKVTHTSGALVLDIGATHTHEGGTIGSGTTLAPNP